MPRRITTTVPLPVPLRPSWPTSLTSSTPSLARCIYAPLHAAILHGSRLSPHGRARVLGVAATCSGCLLLQAAEARMALLALSQRMMRVLAGASVLDQLTLRRQTLQVTSVESLCLPPAPSACVLVTLRCAGCAPQGRLKMRTYPCSGDGTATNLMALPAHRLGAHCDATLLTLLWSDAPGLQVVDPSSLGPEWEPSHIMVRAATHFEPASERVRGAPVHVGRILLPRSTRRSALIEFEHAGGPQPRRVGGCQPWDPCPPNSSQSIGQQ